MASLVWIAALLLLVDLGLLTYVLVCRHVIAAAPVALTEYSPLIVGAGVLVAIITLGFNVRRQSSEDYLESATELLEKAYDLLARTDESGRPKNSRIQWLGAARLLRSAENIGKRISVSSHKAIYREQREYWRARFSDLINPTVEGFPEEYFAESPGTMIAWSDDNRDPLAESSLTVLYRFVRWPKGFADAIKCDPKFTDDEISKMELFGPRGLGKLMRKVRELEGGSKSDA